MYYYYCELYGHIIDIIEQKKVSRLLIIKKKYKPYADFIVIFHSMNNQSVVFGKIVEQRRSVRKFSDDVVPDDVVRRSLDRALLSPNSSNLQLWEFYRVKSSDNLKKLAHYCLDQNAATSAQEMVVVVVRKDKWKKHADYVLQQSRALFPAQPGKREKLVEQYYSKVIPSLYFADPLDLWGKGKKVAANVVGMFRPMIREVSAEDMRVVVHKSAALAAQTFMLSISAEGYDTCPMEGFDSVKVKQLLQLPSQAEINMVISIGKGKEDGIYGPRLRVDSQSVVFER